MNRIIVLPFLLSVFLFASCESVPEHISEDLSPKEYFQEGQAALAKSHYKTALLYYTTFIERFPDDLATIVEAEYEIAFIHLRSGYEKTAQKLFEEILARYSQPDSNLLPTWPRVLASRNLEIIAGQADSGP